MEREVKKFIEVTEAEYQVNNRDDMLLSVSKEEMVQLKRALIRQKDYIMEMYETAKENDMTKWIMEFGKELDNLSDLYIRCLRVEGVL